MGCFTVLKSKKKRVEHSQSFKSVTCKEHAPTSLPVPQVQTRSLQSAPSSFKTRVKPIPFNNKISNHRTRASSAPCSLDAAEQDALAHIEFEEQEETKGHAGQVKERQSSPQPLPLPAPQATGVLKATGSIKGGNYSGPLVTSGPLPLPRGLRNFSYEEVSAACHHFSSDVCASEGLSSVMYNASFSDDASSSKKFEATVTRLHPSTQVGACCAI